MKSFFVLIFLLFLNQLLIGQNSNTIYPSYDVVVSNFFSHYDENARPKELSLHEEIQFTKKPDGWHVVLVEYIPEKNNIKDELFWARKKKRFKQIKFKKIEGNSENQNYLSEYKNIWSKRLYQLSPYYGYDGWDWDVIKDFEGKENLSDSLLYALGRAYSSIASNLLNDNSGLAEKSKQFDLSSGKNTMTTEQLKEYRYYRHHAIEKFQLLNSRNPKFEVLVGSIGIKASNEHLTSFLDLRVFQNEEEANKEIKAGLYNEFTISTAKNYLNSCAKNAILYVNGDNDTYPLLYVQTQYNVRKDVLVINLSLLNTESYINHLRERVLDSKALPISFSESQLKGENMNYLLVDEDENEQDLNKVLDDIRYKINIDKTKDRFHLPTNRFSLKYNEEIIKWEIKNHYITRNQLIVYDALATNNWERPIYFAITVGSESFYGLSKYFQLEGLAYRLVSKKMISPDGQTGVVNTSVMYDHLMNKFHALGENNGSFENRMIMNYRNNYSRLATALIEEDKKDSALLVLDRCIDMMPNELSAYNYFNISIIESYYKLNEFEKGNKLANQLIYNVTKGLNNNINDKNPVEVESQNKYIFFHLKSIAEKYNQQDKINSPK